ncbi:helix-turn-helix domain-containing protein [Parasphingopyxis lamellibrachiae]|uniref:DNA-binding XRE family transcriptional regulator n=1 Tax=Parasphingopyxis lamellibrachiae TaxID=680125 RepID=A0A3D9FGA0_9SPHN|nr:helix-turn-helix transcriptional regulator [Parasphingopyxis lamellibrachiae]RED16835.1 DNA-binding XRE family transcriptional regulator [Parasphingopyxis lamellibrachiae]
MYGRALKLIRQYHRLSQIELADQLDVSPSYLNEIEREKKEPSLDVLKRYARRFDIPLSSLVLFAERSDQSAKEGARSFIADKALRMLEWIAEEPGSENGEKTQTAYTS